MKKILIVIPTFGIGGTIVSTKNLILLLDRKKYDITVLCMTGKGSMINTYNNIKQIPTTRILSSLTIQSWKSGNNIMEKLFNGIVRKISKNKKIREIIFQNQAKKIAIKKFDTVIACQEGICTEFVSHINCQNKIAWVRCDYSKSVYNKSVDEKVYSNFNKIVCVSDLTSERFKEIYPQYAEKTIAINNPQSEDYIIEQSLNNDNDPLFIKKGYTIVSIGRIDPIKRFSEIPRIASFLALKNLEFKWYIIGDGSKEEKRKIRENIIKEKVEEYVVCLGLKTNPHYYIKNADLLVSLSISEACPRVINEAKILHVPVVCTNFDTAKEYIDNMKNGFISPIDEIKHSILKIIQNEELKNNIIANISKFHFDNDDILKKINEVL
ncbi:MAG: glycosyltransferase [Bacteroidales bacterium]|nr:glycosyltransferase [Bacteroidales bacterium]